MWCSNKEALAMKNFFFYTDKNFLSCFRSFLQGRQKTNDEVIKSVKKVIDDVKINKDSAVIKFTQKFDNINDVYDNFHKAYFKSWDDGKHMGSGEFVAFNGSGGLFLKNFDKYFSEFKGSFAFYKSCSTR